MKKWVGFLLIFGISVITLLVVIVLQKKTVEEVVDMRLNMDYEIIHTEQVDNFTIVLAKVGDGQMQFVIVKRGLLANLAIYDGYASEIDKVIDRIGITFYEIPKSIMDNKHICFGFLEKDEISSLTLSDQTDLAYAKVADLAEYAFWIADVTNIKERQIRISGYDADSKQVLESEEVLIGN